MYNRGVTIIELLVVLILIGLMALLLSPFVRMVGAKSREVICEHNLQELSIALREYAAENEGALPEDLGLLYAQGYIDKKRIFDCPQSQNAGEPLNPDYVYVKGLDLNAEENTVILYDKKDNHKDKSINVLYLNGDIVKVGAMAE